MSWWCNSNEIVSLDSTNMKIPVRGVRSKKPPPKRKVAKWWSRYYFAIMSQQKLLSSLQKKPVTGPTAVLMPGSRTSSWCLIAATVVVSNLKGPVDPSRDIFPGTNHQPRYQSSRFVFGGSRTFSVASRTLACLEAQGTSGAFAHFGGPCPSGLRA